MKPPQRDYFVIYDYGGGNLDITLVDTAAPSVAPRVRELPVMRLLRLQQLRQDLAHRTARHKLRVTPEQEYQDSVIYQAVRAEMQSLLAVLEKYR